MCSDIAANFPDVIRADKDPPEDSASEEGCTFDYSCEL